MEKYCCYKNSIKDFLKSSRDQWMKEMISNFREVYSSLPVLSDEQIVAWLDCYDCLKVELEGVNDDYYIIFEYRLRYEGGRRPDVLILSTNEVAVLEFKQSKYIKNADLDQVLDYAMDIELYHTGSSNKNVIPMLVLTGPRNERVFKEKPTYYELQNNIIVCGAQRINKALLNNLTGEGLSDNQANTWIDSESLLIPDILTACNDIFDDRIEELQLKSNTNIEATLDYLIKLSNDHWVSKSTKTHMVVFVTGVPGSGKTLLAMKLVKKSHKRQNDSVYITGNGPLLQVISYSIDKHFTDKYKRMSMKPSKAYFRSVHAMLSEKSSIPFKIIAFDEGQRAWNESHMREKRKASSSEVEALLKKLETDREKVILFSFIGEGQSIHNGEENDISVWANALNKSERINKWRIICPPNLEHSLKSCNELTDNIERCKLNLESSIRQHQLKNNNLGELINYIFDKPNELEFIKSEFSSIKRNGYKVYITRNLETAKKYCEDRYSPDYRYGLIASSKGAKLLGMYDINCDFESTKNINIGAWYTEVKGINGSSFNFEEIITEFQCQGLEIEMPIVCWSDDLLWDESWKPAGFDKLKKDYRLNSYRVLLTRGRNGMILYIPENIKLDKVYQRWIELLGMDSILKEETDGNI